MERYQLRLAAGMGLGVLSLCLAAWAAPAEKPADPKPADPKPAESKPAESKPAESKPAESKKAAPKRVPPKLPADTPILPLWAKGEVPLAKGDGEADTPSIGVFAAPADKATGAAVVICPGGGYGVLAIDHEGTQVARWLSGLGVHAFVLRYRLAPAYRHPCMMMDVQRALRTVRAKAADYKIDPARVGVLGFSAGGHLASTAATHFDAGKAEAADPVERESCRPDFAILIYPVITLKPPHAHGGSARNLLGDKPDAELLESLCNHTQVTDKTPPTLLVHSTDDKAVVVANSEMFAEACKKAGVPVELLIYKQGGHGYGLGKPGIDAAEWPQKAADWLKSRRVLDRK